MTRPRRAALGASIASARTAAGLSQEQLGQQSELGQTAISRIESGDRKVEALELARISDVLGVSLADLLRTNTVDLVALRGQVGDSEDLRALADDIARIEALEDELHTS